MKKGLAIGVFVLGILMTGISITTMILTPSGKAGFPQGA